MNEDNILRAQGINPASLLGRRLKRAGKVKLPEKVEPAKLIKNVVSKKKVEIKNVKSKKSKEKTPKTR